MMRSYTMGIPYGKLNKNLITDEICINKTKMVLLCRKSFDWGLYSIDTVMDRQELRGNTFLALANFGDHALHHLFPTLDHGILPEIYGEFFETLMEFEAESQCYPWFFETIKGQFKQLARTEPMKLDSHERYLLKNGKQSKSE